MSYTTWMLNYGFIKFYEGYEAAGLTYMYCDMIKWPLDYFLKCWKPDEGRLYTQVQYNELISKFKFVPVSSLGISIMCL